MLHFDVSIGEHTEYAWVSTVRSRKVAMPLFEIGNDELVPFRRVQAGQGLYEQEIEELL